MAARAPTDAQLTRRCRQGDERAWRLLIRRFTPQVYRLALRILRHKEEAEDTSQEVFLRMFKSFDSYDPTRPLSPWVSKITYNVCLRRLEGKSAAILRDAVDRDLTSMQDHKEGNPEGRTQRAEAADALERAMENLSAQDRALLTMQYREGLSTAEVAEAVSMPVNTVKTRLFRARKILRERLSPAFEEEGS